MSDSAAGRVAVITGAGSASGIVVAPGWIATGSQTAREAAAGARTPIGRSGTSDEVASLVAWLAAPQAAYLTGQLIVIDGGNSIVEDHDA